MFMTPSPANTAMAIILLQDGSRITTEMILPRRPGEWDRAMREIGNASQVRTWRGQIAGLVYVGYGSPTIYNRNEALEVLGLEG